jgi:hypothetical protein
MPCNLQNAPLEPENLANTTTSAASGRPVMQIARNARVSCRAANPRCLQGDLTVQGKYQRCLKYNKEGVLTVLNQKKRQKPTDIRVTELENQIKRLSTLLKKQNFLTIQASESIFNTAKTFAYDAELQESIGSGADVRDRRLGDLYDHQTPPDSSNSGSHSIRNTSASQSLSLNSGFQPTASSATPSSINGSFNVKRSRFSGQTLDFIDRGLLSLNRASSFFERYTRELAQHYPAVIFAVDTCADEIRRSKPVLFLAVIAAGSGTTGAELNRILNEEILKIYADQVIVHGEKPPISTYE